MNVDVLSSSCLRRMEKTMGVTGSRFIRSDGPSKVTGEGRYTADLRLAGMAHAKFLFARISHARIRTLDTSRARALPGVFAVITQADVPDIRHGGGYGGVKDRTLFAKDLIRFEGEILAAVAARSLEIAEEACRLIVVDYEPQEPVLDVELALQTDSPLVHERWEAYEATPGYIRHRNSCSYNTIVKGDVAQGFALADEIIEDRFQTDMSHPVPIEPHAVLAQWEGEKVTIWTTTQVPFITRAGVGEILQLPERAIRVIVPLLGGGFGGKCDFHFEPHIVALARKSGRPVRLVLSREEVFVATDMARHPIVIELRTGVRRDGTMTAREARLILDTGAYAGHGPLLSEIASMMAAGPYRVPHLRIEAHAVYTNKTVAGSTRGPTAPQVVWAVEQHHDRLAARIGMDPVEFRLRNVVQDGDEGPTGQTIEACGLRDCITKATDLIEWHRPREPDEGVGLALGWWTSLAMRSGAFVEINADGTATVVTGGQENGSGGVMAMGLLAAQELGLKPEQVTLVYQDTDAGPWDVGSCGSQTTVNLGRAVITAARVAAQRLRELAADELQVAPHDLELAEGQVRVKGMPQKSVAITTLMMKAHWVNREPILAHGAPAAPPMPAHSVSGCVGRVAVTAFHSPTFYCHAVRLRVDRETGVVQVKKVAAVHDFGRIVNPSGAEGQVEGGVAHGLGIALSEGTVFEGGRQRNPHLLDYKLRTTADVPEIAVAFVETNNEGHPRGSKGAGEAPVIPTAGAVANAIAQATGARVRELPMTPYRIWAAMTRGIDESANECDLCRAS
jgi:CO/xanthine dehydrogenase Mo-binding subunit